MKCELRRLHSPDVHALDQFAPVDPSEFGVLIQAMIGPVDGVGEEAFDFVACSPAWLRRRLEGQYRWGHGLLILREYDYELICSAIRKLCASIEGSSWQEIGAQLARVMLWEFDGYRPAPNGPAD